MEIGRDDIAEAAELFAVVRLGQLHALIFELPRRPVAEVRQIFAQRLRFLRDALLLVARSVKAVEQAGKCFLRLAPDGLAVLRDRDAREVPRLPLAQQQLRRFYAALQRIERIGQRARQRAVSGPVRGVERTENLHRHLSAHQRRDAAERVQQPFVERLALVPALQQRENRLRRLAENFLFILPRRLMVIEAGQDLPFGGHLKVHAPQAVEDASLAVRQDEVRVAAHDLEDQVFLRGAAHLVGAVEREVDEPLHPRLRDRGEFPPDEVLAQQHAEHRRLRRVLLRDIGEMDARLIRRRRQQQAASAARSAQRQNDGVPRGLLHLVYAAADRARAKLFGESGQK